MMKNGFYNYFEDPAIVSIVLGREAFLIMDLGASPGRHSGGMAGSVNI